MGAIQKKIRQQLLPASLPFCPQTFAKETWIILVEVEQLGSSYSCLACEQEAGAREGSV